MPNHHKLGAYLAAPHDPAQWKRYLFDINPPWVRLLMPGDAPTGLVSQAYQVCPDAHFSLRWWDLDDGGEPNKRAKLVDPVVKAWNDVAEMVHRIETMEKEASRQGLPFPSRAQLWLNALNEPPTWEKEKREAIVAYSIAGNEEAEKHNLGYMALELAVGHPDEWPPTWEWAAPLFASLKKYGGVLALHEYWQPEGPFYEWNDERGNKRKDWGALAGRWAHLKEDVPIVISECGVDGRIYNRHATPDTGFLKFMNATAYAAQMGIYLQEVKKDDRVLAVLPFLTDFTDKEWASFNTLHAHNEFRMVLEAMDKDDHDESVLGTTVYLPNVPNNGKSGEPIGSPFPGTAVDSPLTVDPFVMRAILDVESGNAGFSATGQLIIRFEAHIFERYVVKADFERHFRYDPEDILNAYYREDRHAEWKHIHLNQASEWQAFKIAQSVIPLTPQAAFLSISMGATQIMGFNHARVGFATPKLMFEAFVKDPAYHLIAFFNYCASDPTLMKAIATRNWREIARLYNGPGLVDLYSARLEAAYNQVKGTFNVK